MLTPKLLDYYFRPGHASAIIEISVHVLICKDHDYQQNLISSSLYHPGPLRLHLNLFITF